MASKCTLIFGTQGGFPVTLAVQLNRATTNNDPSLKLVGPNGEALRQTYLAENGREIRKEERQKAWNGYIVPNDDLEAIDAACKEGGRELHLQFVSKADVPWERATGMYTVYSDPKSGGPTKPGFALLVEAMKKSKSAAVCKWVPKSRQELLVLWVRSDGVLVANSLSFASEVKTPSEHELSYLEAKPTKAQIERGVAQIQDNLAPEGVFESEHDEAVPAREALIQAALNGNKPAKPKTKKSEEPGGLKALLG